MLHERTTRRIHAAAISVNARDAGAAARIRWSGHEVVCGRSDFIGTMRSERAAEMQYCRAPEQEDLSCARKHSLQRIAIRARGARA